MLDLIAGQESDIKKESVPDRIIELLTKSLISKRLKPGDRLPTEYEISEKLNVSRNSVREAIKELSALGVIVTKRGVGSFIAETISDSTLKPAIFSLIFEQGNSEELSELRYSFEGGIAELIIQKVTQEDIEDLVKINNKAKAIDSSLPDAPKTLRDIDIAFHKRIIAITGNKLIMKIGEIIYPLYQASIEKKILISPEIVYTNHLTVIERIKTKDLEGLTDAMRSWSTSEN